jgi:hypothetical protein
MDDDGKGMVLLSEWCTFLKAAEQRLGTDIGKTLSIKAISGGKKAEEKKIKKKKTHGSKTHGQKALESFVVPTTEQLGAMSLEQIDGLFNTFKKTIYFRATTGDLVSFATIVIC